MKLWSKTASLVLVLFSALPASAVSPARFHLPALNAVGDYIFGGVAIDYSGDFLRVRADAVRNISSRTTGPLRLIAAWSPDQQFATALGGINLDPLQPGAVLKNIDSGFVAFSKPGYSCNFYEYILLQEFSNNRWNSIDGLNFGYFQCGSAAFFAPGLAIRRLLNGETAKPIAAPKDDFASFMIQVPSGQSVLKVKSAGGLGEADLYVKFNALPTLSSFDGRSATAGSDESIVIQNPQAGFWYIGLLAKTPIADHSVRPDYGDTSTCVALDPYTACVLDGRFRVRVRYRSAFDNEPVNADASVKNVSGFANHSYETAFFYFNDPNNIEVAVKMLDQGNVDGQGRKTIAVLFGTATLLRVEVNITDLVTNKTQTYPSAFGEQKGATDFTAFVK